MNDVKISLKFVLAVVLIFGLDRAPAQTGTVSGTASLPDTSDWSGIVVTILGQNKSATTQANGQFTISNVAAGPITVQAGKLFYANARINTTLASGQTISLSLSLTRNVSDTMLSQQSPMFLTAVTNNGNIGALNHFVEQGDPGFTWSSQQQLFEASLMIGVEATRVSDAARFILGVAQDNLDQDFQSLSDVVVETQGADSTVLLTAYDDSRANLPPGIPSQPLGIRVTQRTFSYGDSVNNGFLIVQLTLTHTSMVTLQNLVVGWFVDWDVGAIDSTNRGGILFVQNTVPGFNGSQPFETEVAYQRNASSGSTFMGLVPLSQAKFKASRIASNAQEIFVDAPNGGLTEANKYRYMVSRRVTNTYSDFGIEEDLSTIVSMGGFTSGSFDSSTFTLAPNESVMVGFAFVGGDDSTLFIRNALNAQKKWVQLGYGITPLTTVPSLVEQLPTTPFLEQNFPNPFNPLTRLRYHLPSQGNVSIKLYNLLGEEVKTLVSTTSVPGVFEVSWDGKNDQGVNVASGLYIARLEFTSGKGRQLVVQNRKLLLIR